MRKSDVFARAALAAVIAVFTFSAGDAAAQGANLPDTINIPVTFYDFRSDRTNPEFEQPHNGGLMTGMVRTELDSDNKPVAADPADNRMNQGVRFWFRDWNNLSQYKNNGNNYLRKFRPIYMYRAGSSDGPYTVPPPGYRQTLSGNAYADNDNWREGTTRFKWTANAYNDTTIDNIRYSVDTAYTNRVERSNLPFTISNRNTGMYEFNRSCGTDNNNCQREFFPLDNRLFGYEWSPVNDHRRHNYSFTMEVEFEFQVKAGMVFNFEGDDDVWVFIDKGLMLDLGGIHNPEIGSFDVVQKLGQNSIGSSRVLRIFYAERHATGSNILIQTNIIAPPDEIRMSTQGNTSNNTVTPGGSIGTRDADKDTKLYSVVKDDQGNVMDTSQYTCANVEWKFTRADGSTYTKKGCSVVVDDSLAGTLNVQITYRDPGNKVVTSNANMTIYPLEPEFIVIQKDNVNKPSSAVVDKDGNKKGTAGDDIYFGSGTPDATVYVALYDKYGNRVQWGCQPTDNKRCYNVNDVQWASDSDIAAVSDKTTSGSVASVKVTKGVKGEGTVGELKVTYIYTKKDGSNPQLKDAVEVGSKGEPSIAVGPNPFVPGQTLVTAEGSPVNTFYKTVPGIDGKGVLIAVEGAKPLKPGPNGKGGKTSYGKVVIYDAVGNIVLIDALYESATAKRAYGFVWDGKNKKGRTVGPGTYLVRITGEEAGDGGSTLKMQKKIGVTK